MSKSSQKSRIRRNASIRASRSSSRFVLVQNHPSLLGPQSTIPLPLPSLRSTPRTLLRNRPLVQRSLVHLNLEGSETTRLRFALRLELPSRPSLQPPHRPLCHDSQILPQQDRSRGEWLPFFRRGDIETMARKVDRVDRTSHEPSRRELQDCNHGSLQEEQD